MSNVVHLRIPVALLGHWRSDEDDGRSEYVISQDGGDLRVSGFDFVDGEKYHISAVACDQGMVSFDTFMPSTGRRGHIVLKALPEVGRAALTFTFTDSITVSRLPTCGGERT
jgi:hypothetical protein